MLSKTLNAILVALIVGYAGYFFYKLPKFASGEMAPNFKAFTLAGQPFELDNLKGQIVLLDFWGSWCGPCRRENPDLVAINRNFGVRPDFEIVSIGIEADPVRWMNAISADSLNWDIHISEKGRFDSPIAKLYGVKEIPTKYLIDKKGKIIRTNPSTSEINTYLTDNLD